MRRKAEALNWRLRRRRPLRQATIRRWRGNRPRAMRRNNCRKSGRKAELGCSATSRWPSLPPCRWAVPHRLQFPIEDAGSLVAGRASTEGRPTRRRSLRRRQPRCRNQPWQGWQTICLCSWASRFWFPGVGSGWKKKFPSGNAASVASKTLRQFAETVKTAIDSALRRICYNGQRCELSSSPMRGVASCAVGNTH